MSATSSTSKSSYIRKGDAEVAKTPDLEYIPGFIPEDVRETIIELLGELEYTHSTHVFYGLPTMSKVRYCWVTDTKLPYVFGGSMTNELPAHSFDEYPVLRLIQDYVYKATGVKTNSMLINEYDPTAELGEHCDDDVWLGKDFVVPSISLGGERVFRVKPHPKAFSETNAGRDRLIPPRGRSTTSAIHAETSTGGNRKSFDYLLESGSLVVMGPSMQRYWHHSIPKQTQKNYDPRTRYNLTLRNVHPELYHLMPKPKKAPTRRTNEDGKPLCV